MLYKFLLFSLLTLFTRRCEVSVAVVVVLVVVVLLLLLVVYKIHKVSGTMDLTIRGGKTRGRKKKKRERSDTKGRCIKCGQWKEGERERDQLMAATAAMQVQMVIRISETG